MKKLLVAFAIICSLWMIGHMFANEGNEQTKQAQLQALKENYEHEQQKIIFERTSYAEHIAIKANIVSDEGLKQAVEGNPINFPEKLKGSSSYLLVWLTNNGGSGVWGTLQCKIESAKTIDVNVPFLAPQKDKSRIFVVPLDGAPIGDLNPAEIRIICTWKELYAKP